MPRSRSGRASVPVRASSRPAASRPPRWIHWSGSGHGSDSTDRPARRRRPPRSRGSAPGRRTRGRAAARAPRARPPAATCSLGLSDQRAQPRARRGRRPPTARRRALNSRSRPEAWRTNRGSNGSRSVVVLIGRPPLPRARRSALLISPARRAPAEHARTSRRVARPSRAGTGRRRRRCPRRGRSRAAASAGSGAERRVQQRLERVVVALHLGRQHRRPVVRARSAARRARPSQFVL